MDSKDSPPKLALGLSLFIIGSILLFGKYDREPQEASSFENEPLKIEDFSLEEIDESSIPKRIIIPKVSIDIPIRRARIINGFWEVFEDSAGWGSGSGIPGRNGNQVIFAHAREGLFLPLQLIKSQDKVYVLTSSSYFVYDIKEIKEVFPDQVEILQPTEDETLTLYTCSGFKDKKRLIVIAKRQ